jgi:hypothetical protein
LMTGGMAFFMKWDVSVGATWPSIT